MHHHLRKLYISLDAILDFRLGVLNLIDAEFAFAVTTEASYYTRDEDRFSTPQLRSVDQQPWGELTPALFAQLSEQCQARLPALSLKTKINKFVRHLCASHWSSVIKEGQDIQVEIDVNVYPHQFTLEEQADLRIVLKEYFGQFFAISLINKSPKELLLDEVRELYFGMVFYAYAPWVNAQDLALKKKPLTHTSLYVPRLYFGGRPRTDVLAEYTKKKTDPFEYFTQVLKPILPIQYLPVAFFSADVPHNLPEWTDPS